MTRETMTDIEAPSRAPLNVHQARRLRVSCEHIDQVIGRIEGVLAASESRAAFPQYVPDIAPAQRRTIEDYLARIRAQLVRVLDGQGIPRTIPSIPASRSIHVALVAIDDSVEELRPKYMGGYGAVPAETELDGIAGELQALVRGLDRYLAGGAGQDLRGRLELLEGAGNDLALLARIERVVADRGLVEFRGAIAAILDRAEDRTFECAVFGRVSSGKSSLLNAVLGTDLLPVGVTPVTAVPTRLVYGEPPSLSVERAAAPPKTVDIAALAEFTSEQQNPGNAKHVTRLVARLPAPRLRGGVGFVDTPGLGSLATHGARETLAYLPQCDLGLVLVDAGSTLTAEDVQTVLALFEAAVPVQVLLSKADVLSPEECAATTRYIAEHLGEACQAEVPVYPVSTRTSHRHLLERWFDEQILPLNGRSQELRAASVQRKIGALRAAVATALRLRLERSAATPDEVRTIEARLRRSAGAIATTRTACDLEIDAMAAAFRAALQEAADRVTAGDTDPGETIRRSLVASVQGPTERCRTLMVSLARRLEDDLGESAAMLGIDDPAADDLVSCIRGMPVFDPGAIAFPVVRAPIGGLLGRHRAERKQASLFRRELGPALEQAFANHRDVLKAWTQQVTDELGRRFETEAERYRAQAGLILAGPASTAEERDAIEADLRDLETPPSETSRGGAGDPQEIPQR